MTDNASTLGARESTDRDLEGLFAPQSIAVVGASRTKGSVGNAIIQNLIFGEYSGTVYPINPKAKSIMGIRSVPNLTELEEPADLVVIVIPPTAAEGVIIQAADRGTKNFVVITAGFKEIGGEGVKREDRLRDLARERGLNVLGPNCLGVINTAREVNMNATFAREMPKRGHLGLISQSGALCTALLDYAKGIGMGFSRFISFGNKVDISEVDLLKSLASDSNTKVILMYVEELTGGQAFLNAAYDITHGPNPKPILAIKTGRTAQGAAAAASHTGSLAGSDEVYDAIMTQAGVIRVESVKDLFDYAEIFEDGTLPRGRQTAIVTNAGGPGIMATDACIRNDLKLAKFHDYTVKSLKFQMPATGSLKNPVDVIGDAKSDRYRSALDAVTADESVDQAVVIVTPQMMTDVSEIANVIGDIKEFCRKPVVACLMGLADMKQGVELLKKYGVPTFQFPEDAMRALSTKNRFTEWTRSPAHPYRQFEVGHQAVEELFDSELAQGRTQLVELRALDALAHYGFNLVPYALAKTPEESAKAAAEMGFPVVLKISGPTILHKTDVGGVQLNLQTEEEVKAAHKEMIASVKAKMGEDVEIWGVLVQKMLAPGKEIILGVTRNPQFGPLLMFGLGGIYTEALRDVSFRLAPIRDNVAAEMVKDIRSYRLLEGVRGEAPSDIDAIAECLLRLSQLVTDHPRISELDMNPLIVYPRGQGAVVADARIILSKE